MSHIPKRYQELAREALARVDVLGEDPVAAVCRAIEKAVDEHLNAIDIPGIPVRCRGMRRVAHYLAHHGSGTPSTIGLAHGYSASVASAYLRRMKRAGVVTSREGRWELQREARASMKVA